MSALSLNTEIHQWTTCQHSLHRLLHRLPHRHSHLPRLLRQSRQSTVLGQLWVMGEPRCTTVCDPAQLPKGQGLDLPNALQ